MTRPHRFLFRMMLFLAAVIAVAASLYPTLAPAFQANPPLNALILAVLLLGIAYIFRQVLMLGPEILWLEAIRSGQQPTSDLRPRLLAPMANMLADRLAGRSGRLSLSALSARSLLDGVSARLDESRDLSRYLIGLLIFLGLLGTFWGLLRTVSAIGGVIGGLDLQGGDVAAMFGNLQQGLRAPLGGMGTAFSSSMFGLAGSLVLGFLELQAGQAQNRFYMDLEDWLAAGTRLSAGAPVELGEAPVPAYLQALIETTAENIERLQYTLAQSDENRRTTNAGLIGLTEKLSALTDQMRAEQQLMVRLAENQIEMRPVLQRLGEALGGGGGMGLDEATRTHIRNLELYMARVLEEMTQGRGQAVQELRNELKILARTVAALGERS
jgi:hypothetical protein